MGDTVDDLVRLKQLHEQGVLTDEQFEKQKASILDRPPAAKAKQTPGPGSRLIGAAIVLLIVFAAGKCATSGTYHQPTQLPTNTSAGQNADATIVMQVTAAELAAAYQGNEVAAQARYGGRRLVVTGVVEKVGLDFADDPTIELQGNDTFRTTQIGLSKDYSSKAAAISKGQTITATCNKITEIMSLPVLSDCSI